MFFLGGGRRGRGKAFTPGELAPALVSAFSGVLRSQPPVPRGKGWGSPQTPHSAHARSRSGTQAQSQVQPHGYVAPELWHALCTVRSVHAWLHLRRLDSGLRTPSCSPSSSQTLTRVAAVPRRVGRGRAGAVGEATVCLHLCSHRDPPWRSPL